MARILVTEKLAESGLQALAAAGHDVDVQTGLLPEQLVEAVRGAHALIIRSATQVTDEVLEAGTDIVVVGRAGVGVDNVDVPSATRRGVMVVNAPTSNSVSTAEHAMALLLAQARNIPQADAALKSGKWERSRWEGIELYGKTLGVLGLGRIGTLVAQRASAFGMRVVAHDPFVTPDRARQLNIQLLSVEELMAESDFLTIHAVKNKETVGLLGKEMLAKAKPGLRVVNAARGGIIDESALAQAIEDGVIGGAALDVFEVEPTTDSPLFGLDSVVVTPHLAASTSEAQDKAGEVISEQVLLALAGEFVPFAINIEASEANETVRPYVSLAERLGRAFASLVVEAPSTIDVEYQGGLADFDTRLLTLSVLKGVFSHGSEEPVSYVTAPGLAAERGVEVREVSTATAHDYVNLIVIRGGDHAIGGTLFGLKGEARIVMIDDHDIELPMSQHLLLVRNDDRPGMVGLVGRTLAEGEVNIADLRLGRGRTDESAMMVLSTDQAVSDEVIERLASSPGILAVHTITQD